MTQIFPVDDCVIEVTKVLGFGHIFQYKLLLTSNFTEIVMFIYSQSNLADSLMPSL